jgi:hypothetical protein
MHPIGIRDEFVSGIFVKQEMSEPLDQYRSVNTRTCTSYRNNIAQNFRPAVSKPLNIENEHPLRIFGPLRAPFQDSAGRRHKNIENGRKSAHFQYFYV